MADTIHLELVTPERRVFAEEVDEITAQAVLGQFGVLPGHANLLALLKPGELAFIVQGKRRHLAVAGGFAQVSLDEGIRILAEAAEFAEEIDVERAKTAKERAEKRLGEFDPATQADDLALAESALHRALVRLQVAEKAQV